MRRVSLSYYNIILLAIVFALTNIGCSHSDEADFDSTVIATGRQIQDSIWNMNLKAAQSLIKMNKEVARTPDEYYFFNMYDAIYDAHANKKGTVDHYKQTLRYVNSQPKSKIRNTIKLKLYQTKLYNFLSFDYNEDSIRHYIGLTYQTSNYVSKYFDKISLLNLIAASYFTMGEWDKSVGMYYETILAANKLPYNPSKLISLYNGIASSYMFLKDFEQCKLWLDKSKALWNFMDIQNKFMYLSDLGNYYYYLENYPRCQQTMEQLDRLMHSNASLEWNDQFNHVNLIDVYLKQHKDDKAAKLLPTALAFFKKENNSVCLSYLHTLEMEAALHKKDINKVKQLIATYPVEKEMKADILLLRYKFVQKFYTEQQDWKNAFKWRKLYTDLNDSLRNDRIRMHTAELRMRYKRDITLLQQQANLAQKESQLILTYVGLTLSFITVALLGFIVLSIKRKNKINEARMLNYIVGLRMKDIRNRITPHFIYNALNHEMLAQQEGKPSQLNTLTNLLRQEQLLTGEFCTTLQKELDFIHLYVRIEGDSIDGGIKFSVNIANGLKAEEIFLPSMMIQIFVENAIKHGIKKHTWEEGEDKKICIEVKQQDEQTIIEVKNNGELLNPQQDGGGSQVGLKVVKQTIQLLNEHNKHKMSFALMNYNEHDEQGCCAQLIIPLHYTYNISKEWRPQ